MPEHSPEHSDEKSVPFGLLRQEESNSLEYAQSLESLKRFAGLDLTTIKNLEDLSARASLVGCDIKTVVSAKGKFQEKESRDRKPGVIDRTYAYSIKKPIRNHEIVVLSDKGYSRITVSKSTREGEGDAFTVRLPSNRDLHLPNNSQISSMTALHAVDWRFGNSIYYYPISYPNDPETNQGFARILQEGVKELLSVLPEPTKVPEVFNF